MRSLILSGWRFGRRGDRARPLASEERALGGDHHPQVQDHGLELCQEFQGLSAPISQYYKFQRQFHRQIVSSY